MSSRLLLLLAVVCVSTAALFAHRALQEATPLAIAAWRLGFAAVFFGAWGAVSRSRDTGRAAMTVPARRRLVLAGVCLALHFLLWFASLQYIPVARSTLLVCTTPLWTALGGIVWARRLPSRFYWPALCLAAVGVWLVTRTAAEPHTALSLRGDVLALAGGACIAAYLLCVEGLHRTLSARRQVSVAYAVAAGVLWGALAVRGGAGHYGAGTWAAIVGMAVGPQIVGHTLLNNALRYFPSSTVAFALLLEPVITAMLAWLLLRQAVTAGQMAGGTLVVIGLALVVAQKPVPSGDSVPAG